MSRRIRSLRFAPAPWVATVLSAVLPLVPQGPARAQCDPDVAWDVYPPTGDVVEILTTGETAWVAAQGGVIRVQTSGVSSLAPEQNKITDREGLVSTQLTSMARDAFGNLWVGTAEDGITVLAPDGSHVQDLSSFRELWSDRVLAIAGHGDRMVVTSADGFTPQGTPEGGGFVILTETQDADGHLQLTPAPGSDIEVARDILVEDSAIWFGTSGSGLWVRDETVVPADVRAQLTSFEGLLSNNVKKVVRAPKYPSGTPVLWLGSGGGLQNYDPDTGALETVTALVGWNILDLYLQGNSLWVLAELGEVRDLYQLDLTSSPNPIRIPRSPCATDTSYVPRQVALDSAGRVVLGTRASGYFVREGLDWYCPPPLGPHFPQIADLAYHPDGTLYFGTGDKNRRLLGNGVGVFDGSDWTSITRDAGIVHPNMTEVLVWGDGTVWMGTSVSGTDGGLNRYFPESGLIETYHPSVVVPARRTQGRQVRSLETDRAGNLWVVYGQNPGGGLSVIEPPPSLLVTNYDFASLFTGILLLRDLAFDSAGRIYVCTSTTNTLPSQLYVLDTRGTVSDRSDDRSVAFNLPGLVPVPIDIGECNEIEIDASDRIWIAGEKGLALGQISSGTWPPVITWQRVVPSATQSGGRNPLPYVVGSLDWDDNLWLGTEAAGLVRISRDLSTWTWFDQQQGCPLPDQSVRGIYMDRSRKRVWVGTASGGIARLDLSAARSPGTGEGLDPGPYPNPWNPERDGLLRFAGISADQVVDLRIYTLGGELVHEELGAAGEKSWNGHNLGGLFVESGVYVITAKATGGATYEGKVAVLR